MEKVKWQGSHCDLTVEHQLGGQSFVRLVPVWGPGHYDDAGAEIGRAGYHQGYQFGSPRAWRYLRPASPTQVGATSRDVTGELSPAWLKFGTAGEALAWASQDQNLWRFWKAPSEARRPGWVGNEYRQTAPLYVRGKNDAGSDLLLWGFARKGKTLVTILDGGFGMFLVDEDQDQSRLWQPQVWSLAAEFLR